MVTIGCKNNVNYLKLVNFFYLHIFTLSEKLDNQANSMTTVKVYV